jgi:phosphoenolpyruvate synthase/pyruvate phosphate dikinase
MLAGLQALSDGFRPSAGSPSKRSELENAAEANGMAELFAKAAELRAHIASSPLSETAAAAVDAALRAASLAERPVAVRSSATSEDGAEASFAGQHDTFLSGRHKRATFPTSKAPISAVFHSFRLIFGRAIISRGGLEAWMLFLGTRARGTLTLKRR